jgi:hypothetical protein
MLLLVGASLKLHPAAQLVHDKRLGVNLKVNHRPSALIDHGLDFTRLLGQRVERIVCRLHRRRFMLKANWGARFEPQRNWEVPA